MSPAIGLDIATTMNVFKVIKLSFRLTATLISLIISYYYYAALIGFLISPSFLLLQLWLINNNGVVGAVFLSHCTCTTFVGTFFAFLFVYLLDASRHLLQYNKIIMWIKV